MVTMTGPRNPITFAPALSGDGGVGKGLAITPLTWCLSPGVHFSLKPLAPHQPWIDPQRCEHPFSVVMAAPAYDLGCASNRLRNHLTDKHSSRILPWKLSTNQDMPVAKRSTASRELAPGLRARVGLAGGRSFDEWSQAADLALCRGLPQPGIPNRHPQLSL